MKTSKVIWKQLVKGEPIQFGDMFSRNDPNTPEKQSGHDYNLQMQAVHNDHYGEPAYATQYDEPNFLYFWKIWGVGLLGSILSKGRITTGTIVQIIAFGLLKMFKGTTKEQTGLFYLTASPAH